ncbi:MAG: DUF3160 domain-containing protein [Butyrivibrio sp.]|nr:DUF3160 domain-containing protein [Butyrivibrio sp.]
MKKRVVVFLMTLSVALSGCSFPKVGGNTASDASSVSVSGEKTETTETDVNTSVASGKVYLLGDSEKKYYDENLVPSIPSYSVKEDFSNVVYNSHQASRFELEYQSEYNDVIGIRNALIKNNFAIVNDSSYEFFDRYEWNRYDFQPNFITVDSLMHTYHLYFAYLMKQTEKNHIVGELKKLSTQMLESSKNQYDKLKGTDFEAAALRNLEFFYIGCKLLDDSIAAPVSDGSFDSDVNEVLTQISSASGVGSCKLTGLDEDYSQYKPRGYYEGDAELEKYFKAMMWYGRITFNFENEDMVRSALLQSLAIGENADAWERIYCITSFFAGTSDDPGYYELSDIVKKCYGDTVDISALAGNSDAFTKAVSMVKELKAPEINSIPVWEFEENVIPGYRFMGQRFSVDAAIMQRLVYRAVEENSAGQKRMLPDTLDTAAALGSEKAMEILKEQGATDFKNYTENMKAVQEHYNNDNPSIWNVSLYSGWLNTLRPLLEKKGEGYPLYMQNDEWAKKNLETFAGSYAELKHDTILYSKQVAAEMGGGDVDVPDDRGFVDTQPVVFSRFKFLSEKTKEGLDKYGVLDAKEKENLDKLSEIAGTLITISEKELKNEKLTDDDYEYIRCYGGYIEHFWIEANSDKETLGDSNDAPCPVIADIATDPNGSVLEVGTGKADTIYVVFPIDGELHVASGSVYSFYQFEQPISDRLTDSEWIKRIRGGYLDDNMSWVEDTNKPVQPEWTQSYRIQE